jgi:hypothetical protein
MSTISSSTQNFPSGCVASPNGAKTVADRGLAKLSVGLSSLQAVNGATPLAIGNPGFGTRASGQFGLGNFLG